MKHIIIATMGIVFLLSAFVVLSLWEVFDREQADLDDDV